MSNPDGPDVLTPSIDARWRDDFVVELRLQGASGQRIADALMEVEGHCKESGQSATDAFGHAMDYATALELPDESHWSGAQLVRTWVQLLLVVGGAWLVLEGGMAVVRGQEAVVNLASVVSAVGTLVAMLLVFVFSDRIMRFVMQHVLLAGAAFAVVLAALVAVGLPFRNVVLGTLPAVAVLGVGITALVIFGLYTIALRRAGLSLDDPLVAPVPQPGGRG